MHQTITAMYASRSDAERAADQLRTLGLSNIDLHDEAGASGAMTSASSASGESVPSSIWSDIKGLFTGNDLHTYEEGIRRGRTVLTVRADEAHADRVIELLDRTDALDVDAETESYRSEGWQGAPATDAMRTDRADVANDDRIQLVEEQLAVGKRDTVRGGARIRSYVVETPVEEQVRLREEHVRVERTPVTGGELSAADADRLFQDRTIEVSERAEEAVVGKRAVVTEELRVSKDVDERIETVRDTVRRTEVDVDRLEGAGTDPLTRR